MVKVMPIASQPVFPNQNQIVQKKKKKFDEIPSNHKDVSDITPLTQTYENNTKHLNILVTVSRHYIAKCKSTLS